MAFRYKNIYNKTAVTANYISSGEIRKKVNWFVVLAGGDLNALTSTIGFAAGIFIGTRFLNMGFSLKRAMEAVYEKIGSEEYILLEEKE